MLSNPLPFLPSFLPSFLQSLLQSLQPQDIEFFTDGTDVLLDFPGGGYPMKLTLEPDDIDFESVKGSLNWLHQSSTLSTLSRSLMVRGGGARGGWVQ